MFATTFFLTTLCHQDPQISFLKTNDCQHPNFDQVDYPHQAEPHSSRIFPILYSLEFIDLNQHYWLSLNKFKLNQISTSMTHVVLPRHIHDHQLTQQNRKQGKKNSQSNFIGSLLFSFIHWHLNNLIYWKSTDIFQILRSQLKLVCLLHALLTLC